MIYFLTLLLLSFSILFHCLFLSWNSGKEFFYTMSKHQQGETCPGCSTSESIWLLLQYLATTAQQLEAATAGKMLLCPYCLWVQHAWWVQGKDAFQFSPHYDLMGHRLIAAQHISGRQMVLFLQHTFCPTGRQKLQRGQLHIIPTWSCFLFSPQTVQRREFTHLPGALMIYCHDNSPPPGAWGSHNLSSFPPSTFFQPQRNQC